MNEKKFRKLQRLQETSGKSRKAFCEQKGIVYGTYNSWLRKYGVVPSPLHPSTKSDFTEVWVEETASQIRQIRIMVGSEVVIEIPLP